MWECCKSQIWFCNSKSLKCHQLCTIIKHDYQLLQKDKMKTKTEIEQKSISCIIKTQQEFPEFRKYSMEMPANNSNKQEVSTKDLYEYYFYRFFCSLTIYVYYFLTQIQQYVL